MTQIYIYLYTFILLFLPFMLVYRLLRPYIKHKRTKKTLDIVISIPSYLLLLCSAVFLILPLVTDLMPEDRSSSIKFLFYVLVILFIDHFLQKRDKQIERRSAETAEDIREILHSKQQHSFLLLLSHFIFFPGRHRHWHYRRSPYEQDIEAIASFDELVRSGEDAMIPTMQTKEGQRLWDRYIKAYMADRNTKAEGHDLKQKRFDAALLSAGGWRCTCGRANPNYTSTCTCGTHMRQIPPEDRRPAPQPVPTPKPTSWLCPCGRTNPNYTSTCVCGKNKRDIKETP